MSIMVAWWIMLLTKYFPIRLHWFGWINVSLDSLDGKNGHHNGWATRGRARFVGHDGKWWTSTFNRGWCLERCEGVTEGEVCYGIKRGEGMAVTIDGPWSRSHDKSWCDGPWWATWGKVLISWRETGLLAERVMCCWQEWKRQECNDGTESNSAWQDEDDVLCTVCACFVRVFKLTFLIFFLSLTLVLHTYANT